jgi:hypothetical protein
MSMGAVALSKIGFNQIGAQHHSIYMINVHNILVLQPSAVISPHIAAEEE